MSGAILPESSSELPDSVHLLIMVVSLMNSENIRIAAVTGATGVIGKAIAMGLASHQGHGVVLLCRNEGKAIRAMEEVRRQSGNSQISYRVVDVSRKSSVEALAAGWEGPLHVLVNNAGVTPKKREETPEGIEQQFATNVLGYFWMMHFFSNILIRSSPSRIINVVSYWAGDLDLDDPEFKRRRYSNGTAYRQSKQADRMLTVAFARRLRGRNVTVNACHPGDARSTLSMNLGFGGHESPAQAARTPLWVATGQAGLRETGQYFEGEQKSRCPFSRDVQGIERLYETCRQY